MTPRGIIPQIPALDGLRGIAVLLVIAYHLGATSLPGGFLGVDVFFVVSGYLITSLLLAELRDKGYVDLVDFWARRARRLLPALLVLLAAIAAIVPFIAPDAAARVQGGLPPSLFYVNNWWQIFGHHSYFETTGRPDLLQHLWSLAIEEQFYLLWPPVLALLWTRLWRRRWLVAWLTAGATAASVLLMLQLFDPNRDPSRVYYGTDTRVSAILLGATFAFAWPPDIARRVLNPPPVVLDAAGFVGAVLVGYAALHRNGFDPAIYRGGFFFVALGTGLMVVAGSATGTVFSRVLSQSVLRRVGERSYGLYLWHWPIIQLTRPGVDVPLHGTALLLTRVALIAGAAEASWRVVEHPLRRPRSTGRGPIAVRYRRAELVLVIALPALAVPYLADARVGPRTIETTASPAWSSTTVANASSNVATTTTETAATRPTTRSTPPGAATTAAVAADPISTTPPESVPTTAAPAATSGAIGTASAPAPASRGNDVLFLGDSVMLGAKPALLRHFPAGAVDAVVGRQLRDCADLIRTMRTAGQLRGTVVLHLGTNGSATPDQLDEILGLLQDVPRVIMLNTTAPRPWRDAVNDRLEELPSRFANVRLIDWRSVTREEHGLLVEDGIHLTPVGAERYSALLDAALR
ncbi:MAG TPA: acyltransferase family protein [Acidimicrobiales bacterium]|nr:acyltransferase family protein [Acidimicrobiales bacterium]